ncbi:MAG: sporulation integral membrane protein YlbJ [Bacillota bacterium]
MELTPGETSGLFWTALALTFTVSMICKPAVVFAGATMGLKAWWNIVFPSLLPFFIASELLMCFGVVNFIGVLMEPLMRPLFNVPGSGSFAMCIGYTSGYPIGAMVTARLRSQGLCTRTEAERLISFTNNSSPLFMIVAVSVGMFGRPDLAPVIAGSHYLANLTLGVMMRFYGRRGHDSTPAGPAENVARRALQELTSAWKKEKRPLGKILGDSVKNAVNNLLTIGGFIILFAVIIRLMSEAGLIQQLSGLMGVLLTPFGLSKEIMPALASGIFEMTIGSKLASESAAPLIQQIIAVEIILAWSGLSVHAQVAGMISDTDIRMLPFICARVAHAVLAAAYTFIIFNRTVAAASAPIIPPATWQSVFLKTPSFTETIIFSLILLVFSLILLSFLSLAVHLAAKAK